MILNGCFCNLVTLDLQCHFFSFFLCLDSRITDSNVRYLLSAVYTGKCPKLQILLLSNNAMGIRGCKALSLCLSNGSLKEISHLDIQRL